jgi:hypothetical protein
MASLSCMSQGLEIKPLQSTIYVPLMRGCMVLTTPHSIVFIHGLQGHPRNTWTWESDARLPENSVAIERKPKKSTFKSLLKKRNKDAVPDPETIKPARAAVFWPYHLLPQDCSNSRILTWGYDSNIIKFFAPTSKNNIVHHALNLLGDLVAQRNLCVRR